MPLQSTRGASSAIGFGFGAVVKLPVWTAGTDISYSGSGRMGAGTTTDALYFGGLTQGPIGGVTVGATVSYNGTTWTSKSNMPSNGGENGRWQGAFWGNNSNSAYCANGVTRPSSGPFNQTVSFNGSSWSIGTASPVDQRETAGGGTPSSAMQVGGNPNFGGGSETNIANSYNGSSWTSEANYPISFRGANCAGPESDNIVIGGYNGSSPIATCNEYNGTAWSAGGNLSTARQQRACGGSGSKAIVVGGYNTTTLNSQEQYNGTSWSTSAATPISTVFYGSSSPGSTANSQTNFFVVAEGNGGFPQDPDGPESNKTFEWAVV